MSDFSDIFQNDAYITLGEAQSGLFDGLDSFLQKWIFARGAEEYHIPAMIKGDVLEKCGYFETFPQHLTAAAIYRKDQISVLTPETYYENNRFQVTDYFFTPAACLHIYPTLAGREFSENTCFTCLARVYRNEDFNFTGLTRIWDFTVREYVFVGEQAYIDSSLEDAMNTAAAMTAFLGIPAELRAANDHFYPTRKNMIKEMVQKRNAKKFELITEIDGSEVALASFNVHNQHFSGVFDFSDEGRVNTGCVGFGMERWLAAFAAYGVTAARLAEWERIQYGE